MEFREIENPWSSYELPDGTKIKIRHVLTAIKHTDGTPRYDLTFSAIAVTEPAIQPKLDLTNQNSLTLKQTDLQ